MGGLAASPGLWRRILGCSRKLEDFGGPVVRVLLSTYGSRGDVEPLVALAVQLRALGAEVRVCAPPDEDFAQRLADVDVPLVPVGQSARALTTAAPRPSSLSERAAKLIASQF